MKSRILLPVFLLTLHACGNASPFVGTWVPDYNNSEEWLIEEESNKFNLTVTSSGFQLGIFPLEVTDKAFSANVNVGIGSGQYNCSSTDNKDEMNCNLIVNSFISSQNPPFRLVRKK
jgi:hypothetical protein